MFTLQEISPKAPGMGKVPRVAGEAGTPFDGRKVGIVQVGGCPPREALQKALADARRSRQALFEADVLACRARWFEWHRDPKRAKAEEKASRVLYQRLGVKGTPLPDR